MTTYTDAQRDEATDVLQMELESTAEWRAEKAAEFPDDSRNADAAKVCRSLARERSATPDALNRFLAFWENPDCPQTERQSLVMREIGFSRFPENLDEVIEHIVQDWPGGGYVDKDHPDFRATRAHFYSR